MYLKTLSLKGFKSFADKTVLNFETGISAVVGPNGSGKSNISDAILWVLGERNAKNLRGQAMEDVIFAGSAARSATGVAEVELVLDNSDGKIPVDFQEIALGRRMYRSGESEYLINGVVARRMDLLDILHDSGLGTGAHSIISQGSLDSILQSKPEDRRILIEEAAGVLKHKQRKLKSERKIDQMDQHLLRVGDIVREVERQLKPLERKAIKAEKYKTITTELEDLRLHIAVDDLRTLQSLWEESKKNEEALINQSNIAKEEVNAAEKSIEVLQEKIHTEGNDANKIALQYRRAQQILERFDASILLFHEKKRNYQQRRADIELSQQDIHVQFQRFEQEQTSAKNQLEDLQDILAQSEDDLYQAKGDKRRVSSQAKELKSTLHANRSKLHSLRLEKETISARLAQLRENVTTDTAQQSLIANHQEELSLEFKHLQEEYTQIQAKELELEQEVKELSTSDSQLRLKLTKAFDDRAQNQELVHESQARVSQIQAEIKAVKELEKAYIKDNKALSWVLEHKDSLDIENDIVSLIDAPAELMPLLESLLGKSVNAQVLSSAVHAQEIVEKTRFNTKAGSIQLFVDNKTQKPKLKSTKPTRGTFLISLIQFPSHSEALIQGLLGDVVLCENDEEAFLAYEENPNDFCYVTKNGLVLKSNGLLELSVGEIKVSGKFERKEQLKELEEKLSSAEINLDKAQEHLVQAEAVQRSIQEEQLKVSQNLASVRGRYRAQQDETSRMEKKCNSVKLELENQEHRLNEIKAKLEKNTPNLQQLEVRLQDIEKEITSCDSLIDDDQKTLNPLQQQIQKLEKICSEKELEVARLEEKEVYAQRLLLARKQDIERLEKSLKTSNAQLALIEKQQLCIDPLLLIFESLSKSIQTWIIHLETQTEQAQNTSTELHQKAQQVREQAQKAHRRFDALNEQLSQLRVEKGKLELRVDAAIKTIVDDCKTPLDHAIKLEEITEREQIEIRIEELDKARKKLGTINPDAAREYQSLKERYDYMSAQISDVKEAREVLARIVEVINERMREDFVLTFDKVNENFQEIFAVLFPGGTARLSLVGSEDIEHAGVEVEAQPRGKKIAKMTLMSGGEKSLVAIALLFAVYRMRSAPFYVLDEVEAALDDTNLRRLVAYLDSLRNETQLIMITHQRRTMEMADALFGVSMQADGITRVISQKLDRALLDAEG